MSVRRMLRLAAVLLAVAGAAGCAAALDVRYPESGVNPALLTSIAPRRVVIGPVSDRRLDRARIGLRPSSQEAIVTRRPVEEIVREALGAELGRNGHSVVGDVGDVVLAAEVEEFWLDAARRRSVTQYVGRVAIALVVVDARSGSRLLTRRYVGIRRVLGDADAEQVWREVMDTALARTMHDMATDPDLVAALSPR
ncbi:MAG: hypothetical protein ACREJR_04140 [Candidatus Rokuibacteriota bacterium]